MENKNILSLTLLSLMFLVIEIKNILALTLFVMFVVMENKNILALTPWANVQDNPLVPSLAQAAGPCITPNDCALCAKKVVALLQSMESQLMRSERTLYT